MASPPLQVEDQTDEDFFDKLVDDEFAVTQSGSDFPEGDDSDDVKAFSNLSIAEVGTVSGPIGEADASANKEVKHSEDVIVPSADAPEKEVVVAEENVSLVSSNSFSFDNAIYSIDTVTGANVASDSTTSESGVSRDTSIKEVQWSSFNSDLAQHSDSGFGSYSDFFTEFGDSSVAPLEKAEDNPKAASNTISNIAGNVDANMTTSFSSLQQQEDQVYRSATEQTTGGQDMYNSQYWENLYPGWRYDPNNGEWHQVEGYDATSINTQGSLEGFAQSTGNELVSDKRSEVSYLQQTTQSVAGTIAEACTIGTVSSWNQASQMSTEYPSHMVFDPQYPGWYYDTIAQEWHMLESYTAAAQPTDTTHYQQNQNENPLAGDLHPEKDQNQYGEYGQVENYGSQVLSGQDQVGDWAGSTSNYAQKNTNIFQSGAVTKSESAFGFTDNQQSKNLYGSSGHVNNYVDKKLGFMPTGTVSSYEQSTHNYDGSNGFTGFQSFVPSDNFSHQFKQMEAEKGQQINSSHDYYGNQKSGNLSQQHFHAGNQLSYAAKEGRSSAGRPPHALVTFGFGGKLIVMKNNSSFVTNSAFASQDSVGDSISIHNLMEVVMDKIDTSSMGFGACDYFRSLCQQSFPGPLVGGNVGSKELNKWIDERIANCETPHIDYRKGELLRLLFSLLKIACQHYGKLRSPFGTDPTLKENDSPESAVAKLFASAKRNNAQLSGYGVHTHCLQNLPSEGQIRATAVEVQNLLVSGKTKEALQCAQEGQLWGPALVLAAQLGDQSYVDTVKKMAHHQLVAGSPLRTLCLLIAGQPADVFSADSTSGVPPGVGHISQQPAQIGSNCMLDDWEENLAIITANRTKGDELVIIHLGDCLWKERGEITAAHICYLVAEANFESYSDSARLCLIGADHWNFPRTYASPEAIQRTELYEYSKVLGNSQSVLLPFQPYKLIYAHMLAEVGKVSDALKYCQAILKSLKTGRAPEVDSWRQLVSSLEERIKTHQQGGYGTNLAPAKLVGKLLPFIDRSIHRMIGAPPPPAQSTSQSSFQSNEHDSHPLGPRVANSQSTMAMSSLMPSASMEPISEWAGDGNRMIMHNRSISEPDFGRSPRQGQVNQSKEAAASDAQSKASVSGAPSRFGRFGSQILQKTMGWVSRSRPDRQAKLGEKNKFYYDEKLKRWVEEGTEPPSEEAALPPPPPTSVFQNGMSDYNIRDAFKSESLPADEMPETKSPTPLERSPGIPPIPPSSNQFSARGRMGVRSRYVDTFNKSGASTAKFQSPSVPAAKPGGASAKFFIPTPVASGEQTIDTIDKSTPEAVIAEDDPSTSVINDSSISSLPSSSGLSMQRFPSMGSISPMVNKGMGMMGNGNGSLSQLSRRTASWSGSFNDTFNVPRMAEIKPPGEALRMPRSSLVPSDPTSMHQPVNGNSFGDDLHEVEL
ncbi:PREDICTED: protein transport protein SEC16B homolog [Nelumbo nucifera]|uniref:Protein transport protein sec16 n=1 Tax=Nelumbo nucifera TaxID=4432 RepID=A0A1U7ZYK2_NELNU|nr:PREDICTED: protein transport protein SEC16B homolog [Nelumbo nucifera]XP_010258929.1 PREDICTED: protein transport protein SEC16B homolog [Nelumbo nucifera]XP_010258930.1 PREDICTED: protein transport protein SEC16B homolog [Nelumbo nucifera]